MRLNKNIQAFFSLLRSGLWEQTAHLPSCGDVDYSEVYNLAQEQSVVGLIASGLAHISENRPPRSAIVPFMTGVLSIEEKNQAMNEYLRRLMPMLAEAGIRAVLVKGQGVARCYSRPLWRACGDIDLLLDEENYKKAVAFLSARASKVDAESQYNLHQAMTIDGWEVELHGTLRSGLGRRIDRMQDALQADMFSGNKVRVWDSGGVEICLPEVNTDVIFIFTHILQHFFKEGIGLRQICDWCRLLWTYRDSIDTSLLESRIRAMGIMSEWKAFAALAVNTLGMPEEAMPFYSSSRRWDNKSHRLLEFILETGNFGHNRDYSYYRKYPFVVYKAISLWRHTKDTVRYMMIFPLDSIRVWLKKVVRGIKVVASRANDK